MNNIIKFIFVKNVGWTISVHQDNYKDTDISQIHFSSFIT